MATTASIVGINELRAWPDSPSPYARLFEVAVAVSGTYLTASKPSFSLATALQGCHFGVSAGTGIVANIVRDRYDGTNRYTASCALSSVASGWTNDTVTMTIKSGATDGGSGGSEVADTTVVTGVYTVLVIAEITAE